MEPVTSLITEVRAIVQDESPRAWSNDEVLAAADRCYGEIWARLKLSGKDHLLDQVEITPASFTKQGVDEVWDYELPEYVGAVRYVAATMATGIRDTIPIRQADLLTSIFTTAQRPFWTMGPGGFPGKLRIVGKISTWASIRLYFLRRAVKLHYGAQTGAPGDTAKQVLFNTPAAGEVEKRNDLYVGTWIEVTSGASAGERRKITAWDGPNVTATVTPDFTTASFNGMTYELLTLMPDEHDSYFAYRTAKRLISRSWDNESMLNIRIEHDDLEAGFVEDMRERIAGEPEFLRMNQ